MGLSHAPRVITDGIVLGLDAANTRSYVGSGTTWTDLIGSNNGTLTNGPVFTQEPKLEPFGGAGAVSFDGTGDYLSVADDASLDMGSSNFTIEGWYFPLGNANVSTAIFSKRANSSTVGGVLVYYGSTGLTPSLLVDIGGSWTINIASSVSFVANQWNHFAVTRNGSAFNLYINGVSGVSASNAGSIPDNSSAFVIGAMGADGSGTISSCYISNFRVVKGTALYTSNFTPPRKKLEVTSDTVLLTCEKGTIRDRSSSAHAITVTGDAKSISGASYFEFDGTNAYVTIPDSDSFTFGSEDFTIECWTYPNSTGSFPSFISKYAGSSTNSSFFFSLGNSNQTLEFYLYNGVSAQQAVIQAGTVSLSSWNHVVATRIGNQITTYLNGSVAGTQSWSYSVYDANVAVTVGAGQYNGGYYWDGKISGVKIYKSKGLTASEVEQNFNALRGRYGI